MRKGIQVFSRWARRSAAGCAVLAAFGAGRAGEPAWNDFVEPGFPFFSSVVDARKAPGFALAENLTARGLILNLGGGNWACFDLDLLRISAAWTGRAVTPVSLAQISYHEWNRKSQGGEKGLPRPDGPVWLANGLYPGWTPAAEPAWNDPRPRVAFRGDLGRGALPAAWAHFQAVRLTRGGLRLDYSVGGTAISEWISVLPGAAGPGMVRRLQVAASSGPLSLILAARGPEGAPPIAAALARGLNAGCAELRSDARGWVLRIGPHAQASEFSVALASGDTPPAVRWTGLSASAAEAAAPHWPGEEVTSGSLSRKSSAYVVDDIALPLANRWRRNVRPADVQFLPDGTAAVPTLDGDVWIVHGLRDGLKEVRWKRFASGLHEPLSVAVRGGQIYVFDRNGIWRLRDTTGAGEADDYELFSNAFGQTADGREFPNSLSLAPDGSMVIAKGGEQGQTTGRDNGTVMRVSADGARATVLGWGFRQPFAAVDPETGLVTATDQQGNYVPATPLFVVEGDQFHGFLPPFVPAEHYPAPIADPALWLPHAACPSGVGQVWLRGARLGPLNGDLLLLAYNFPSLFRVTKGPGGRPRAAVMITDDLSFPPLHGAVDPADGCAYAAGFGIFETASRRHAGIARLRYTGAPSLLPREVTPMREGILIRFDSPVDPAAAAEPGRYLVERWNYRRTPAYGSLDYRPDGAVGREEMPAAHAYVSLDRRAVFVAIPDLRAGVMQMRIRWAIKAAGGEGMTNEAYFTPYTLGAFAASAAEFGLRAVDLTGAPAPATAAPGSVAAGMRLAQTFGCVACHSVDDAIRVGPSWKGIYGHLAPLSDGTAATVDAAFIRSRLWPHPRQLIVGFPPVMPNYSGVVSDREAEALAAYIRSLR